MKVGYLHKWTRRKVVSGNYSSKVCKQVIMELSLACSFPNICFIGQNVKYVYVAHSIYELLIFFWLNPADTFCLTLIFMKKYST